MGALHENVLVVRGVIMITILCLTLSVFTTFHYINACHGEACTESLQAHDVIVVTPPNIINPMPSDSKNYVKPKDEQRLNTNNNKFMVKDKVHWPVFKVIDSVVDACSNDPVLLLYVHSSPVNFKRRQYMRETFGNSRLQNSLKFVLVFMIGIFNDKFIDGRVDQESARYNDIIREDFQDHYRNLTYKAVMALRWVTVHCPQTQYILKIDDDVFVDMENLMNHLRSMSRLNEDTENTFFCYTWTNTKVMRDTKMKWYVPREEFADEYYATYCAGAAYMMSRDLPRKLFYRSLSTPFFWIDDYFVTGELGKQLKTRFHQWSSIFVLSGISVHGVINEINNSNKVFAHIGNFKIQDKYKLWREVTLTHDVTDDFVERHYPTYTNLTAV